MVSTTTEDREVALRPVAQPNLAIDRLGADTARRHVLIVRGAGAGLDQQVLDLGGRVESWHPASGLVTVLDLDDAAAGLIGARADVFGVARDALVSIDDARTTVTVARVGALGDGEPSAAPAYERQWHLRTIGADAAWAAGFRGGAHLTVAILDTGIDYTHPDLEGLVDLDSSVSFMADEDALVEQNFPGRHPVTDLHYHGTHVAATVASNARLAAGVTGGVRLIGVKVLGVEGSGPVSGVLEGVAHAVDAGADVINLSLGGAIDLGGADALPGIISEAFAYAEEQGVTVVVAAGNDSLVMHDDGGLYNAYCDVASVICVSATGADDALAGYSNVGTQVDVAAPGGASEAVWAACSTSSLVIPDCAVGEPGLVGLGGTSMAAPHVSGLAALLADVHGRDSVRVRRMLEGFSVDLGDPGRDTRFGVGRIDVARALGLSASRFFREHDFVPSVEPGAELDH